jgi:hypothetical protein
MVKFPYNSGWLHDVWGSQAKNIVFEDWRKLPRSCLGTQVLTWLEPETIFRGATILTSFP